MNHQHGAAGETDIGRAFKNNFTFLIAAARAGIDAPGGFIIAIDGK